MEDIVEIETEPKNGILRKNSIKSTSKKTKKKSSPRNLPDLSKHNSSEKFSEQMQTHPSKTHLNKTAN